LGCSKHARPRLSFLRLSHPSGCVLILITRNPCRSHTRAYIYVHRPPIENPCPSLTALGKKRLAHTPLAGAHSGGNTQEQTADTHTESGHMHTNDSPSQAPAAATAGLHVTEVSSHCRVSHILSVAHAGRQWPLCNQGSGRWSDHTRHPAHTPCTYGSLQHATLKKVGALCAQDAAQQRHTLTQCACALLLQRDTQRALLPHRHTHAKNHSRTPT
jgi:hypothetical protein